MKFSFLKNDKSTKKDEFALGMIIIGFLVSGVILCYFHPQFFLISSDNTLVFGVVLIVIGVMFVPGLIYRLITNDRSKQ